MDGNRPRLVDDNFLRDIEAREEIREPLHGKRGGSTSGPMEPWQKSVEA
jgi:hypothetical protein